MIVYIKCGGSVCDRVIVWSCNSAIVIEVVVEKLLLVLGRYIIVAQPMINLWMVGLCVIIVFRLYYHYYTYLYSSSTYFWSIFPSNKNDNLFHWLIALAWSSWTFLWIQKPRKEVKWYNLISLIEDSSQHSHKRLIFLLRSYKNAWSDIRRRTYHLDHWFLIWQFLFITSR